MAEFGNGLTCVDDFEEHAKRKLSHAIYEYYRNGADDELTLRRNRQCFKNLIIRPRFMRDVRDRDLSISLLNGRLRLKSPVCVAPTASQRMAHSDGELATAKAATQMGTLMIASTISTCSLEEIAKAAPEGQRFFQLYVYKDHSITEAVVRRAEAAGYKALVVTVDTPVSGKRRNDYRNSFELPKHLRMANFSNDSGMSLMSNFSRPGHSGFSTYITSFFETGITWSTVDWLKSITSLPIILKGILTAEDALAACQHDIPAIIVSNHGARQLDSCPATIEALPEIVRAVQARCEIYVDGGVRTGNDVFKALALGAKVVFVGRPILWGLAYDGMNGVKNILTILNEELDSTMALAGCQNLQDLKTLKNLVVHRSFYAKL